MLFQGFQKTTFTYQPNSAKKSLIFSRLPGLLLPKPTIYINFYFQGTTYPYGESETFTTDVLPNDEPRSESEEGGFFGSVWHLVMSSINYAADIFRSLTHTDSTTESPVFNATSTESTSAASPASPAGALVALEEFESNHRLPSHEFEKGGRDIDSLLYGVGIA